MYHFIINPNSRSGKGIQIWETVKKELNSQNIAYQAYFTQNELHATRITEEICNQFSGVKNIVVLGGDGTINEVINGIPDFDEVILGYIPSGSSNDLARSLKISKDPIEGLNHILSPSQFKYVDTGVIETKSSNAIRRFAVSTGIGFDAAACVEILHSKLKKVLNKIRLGKLTYIIIALKQLMFSSFMDGVVTIDGKITNNYKHILLITSMIHKYEGGGMQIAPSANPSDGKLSVCIVHGLSRLRILILLPTLLIGKHIKYKGVETFDCKTIEINIQKPAPIHVDGECLGSYEHITVSCTPKQLRIII